MDKYTKILIALDFHDDNHQIIRRGLRVCQNNEAQLYFIHVQEPMAIAYTIDGLDFADQMVAMKQSLRERAEQRLEELGKLHNINRSNLLLREGVASDEIERAANDHDIDLVIIGTHGQSGLRSLLGSTANSVLHSVSCDVLMVDLRKQ
ncbi:universal stress protein [Ferrimonas senticii]|uniref:universal stress protein n=1 Tax=Ferrimonas senticii TaxID=394566 RepID=UPI00040C58FB|nr:universal stress protein [Ferrimonas senticii]